MIQCPTCGTENTEQTKFCPECGTGLSPATGVPTTRESRKLVTVLFADVAGSTALGEELDPETLRGLLDRYFGLMHGIIEAHGGTVEKFIGDAVMAVFGIPVIHEDDALRAVRAAEAIRTGLTEFEDAAVGPRTLAFRTGIDTGEVFARDTTSGEAFVTGDAVNVAARLEQTARPGEILIGQTTFQLVRDAVTVEPVEPIDAKGKSEPVRAYRLVAVDVGQTGHARRLDAPLVGREREIGRLEQAFRATVDERSCQLFTLLGPAGIGKSRLIAEFVAAVETEATVLRGRCLSYGEGITYWPIGEIVRAAAGIEEADSSQSARAKLRTLLEGERDADIVATRVAGAIGLSIDAASQEEGFWAIRKAFEHLARKQPLVIVIEDIHWAEQTLLDLIEHVADWSRDTPILLLCPARPELLDARPGWGGGKLNATTVLLEALGPQATGRLVAELPGGRALPADLAARILAAAEGNPLYVEEMLRMLVDDGALIETAGGAWSASDGLAEVRIPASISALLTARLERLAPAERAVAERASVVGRVFEQAAVTELAGETLRPEVGPSLLALVRKELVRPERSELAAGDAFKFRHILIRDAAYEALPKAERAALHERFADWLESTVGERLAEYEEIVGYHLKQAHRYRTELGETGGHVVTLAERAGAHLAAASGRAFDRGDFATAVTLLSEATLMFPRGSAGRLRLMPDLGFALFSAGRIPDADDVLRGAIGEAMAAGQTRMAVHAELERAMVRILADGTHGAPRSEAEAAIPLLERDEDDLGLARAYLVIASAAWIAGRVEDAMAARRTALMHAARAGDMRIEQRTAYWGAECYGPAPAIAAIRDLEVALAGAASDPMKRGQLLFTLSGLYAMRRRPDDAREAYRTCRATLEGVGARLPASATAEIGGVAELIIGDPEAAERMVDDGITRLEGLGATGFLATHRALQSLALARGGHFERALDVAARAAAEGSPEDTLLMVTIQNARATALLGLGDVAGALVTANDAVARAETTDWVSYHADALLILAAALRAAGRDDGSKQAASDALALYRAKQHLPGEERATRFLAS